MNQHSAYLLRVHEQVSVSIENQEIANPPHVTVVQLILCERIALIENAGEIYVLQYVSSPELYEENLPVFEHLLTSFHFTSGNL